LVTELSRITDAFKALSDPTRLRIVRLMAANDEEVCVCELVDSLEVPQYHVSRHLKELRNARLLRARRDGRWVYYSLDLTDPVVKELAEVVRRLPADLFREDQKNFEQRMTLRVGGRVPRSEEHTSELQSRENLVCRLLLEKKKHRQERS